VYAAGVGLALAVTGAMPGALAAEAGLAAYQGAWLEQSQSCDMMFATGGKGASFRKPLNIFVPAFIISGNRLRTPQATCRILSIQPNGDRDVFRLSCANAISNTEVTALLARNPDGSLRRFFNELDKTGSRYERCAP
jgi:hypothetical protein